jgi:hypothetical protein
MAGFEVPTGLEDVQETYKVGLQVCIRIVNGIAYSRLGTEMQNYCWSVCGKDTFQSLLVREVSLDEGELGIGREHSQPPLLERDIIIVIAVVIADNDATPLEKCLGDMESDEARGPGDQYDGATLECMLVIQSHDQSLSYRSRV